MGYEFGALRKRKIMGPHTPELCVAFGNRPEAKLVKRYEGLGKQSENPALA